MTNAAFHDVLFAASTALPVLFVPVVLLLLDRGRGNPERIRPGMLLLYVIVFANAEVVALAGLARYKAIDDGVIQLGLTDAYSLVLIGTAVLLGLALSLAPIADEMFSAAADTHQVKQTFMVVAVVAAGVLAPTVIGADLLGYGLREPALVLLVPCLALIALARVTVRKRVASHGPTFLDDQVGDGPGSPADDRCQVQPGALIRRPVELACGGERDHGHRGHESHS